MESQLPLVCCTFVVLHSDSRLHHLSRATVNTHSRRQEFFRRHEENRLIDLISICRAGLTSERSAKVLLTLKGFSAITESAKSQKEFETKMAGEAQRFFCRLLHTSLTTHILIVVNSMTSKLPLYFQHCHHFIW